MGDWRDILHFFHFIPIKHFKKKIKFRGGNDLDDDKICPFCKEEIAPGAIICKSCKNRIFRTKQEMAVAMIRKGEYAIPKPSGDPCEALCYAKFHNNKAKLQECLDECKVAIIIAVVAERLKRELEITMEDIIWGGGDIDPVPFEKAVRERFSHPIDKY